LIRRAYFEHPDYVPLVEAAFGDWRELEERTGEKLFHPCGLLQVGPADGAVVSGVRESARRHGLAIENFSAAEVKAEFPGFFAPDGSEGVFERGAGYLLVERCVELHAREAVRLGADLHTGEAIRGWNAEGSAFRVTTDRGEYTAARLVIAAGAWAGQLLAELGIPLEVRRKPLYWFATKSDVYRADKGCPGFLYDLAEGCFYGVPQLDANGVKVGQHSGGAVVSDPLTVNRDVDPVDFGAVAGFVSRYLVEATTERTNHTVCMYTMTPDEHFVVDRHPMHAGMAFAAGLSGHGFKFTSVLGRALAELAIDGRTDLPIGFLSVSRPALHHRAN
jgi:monomeric sarcosine oxidase